MDKKTALLAKISNERPLTDEELGQIDYINLHAHSTYSLQDAVGQVESHFIETIHQGHCGCAITDHGSYASFIDLYNLRDNKKGSKKVKKVFAEKNIKSHNVVMGSELYIIDDRHVAPLIEAAQKNDRECIKVILEKMAVNPKWVAHFEKKDTKSVISINNDELRSEKIDVLIGKDILNNLMNWPKDKLVDKISEFCEVSLKNKSYKYNHITILAKNYQGHQNLCHLTSIGSLPENYYTRPRIRLSHLLDNKEGLIVTTGCFVGMIPQAIYKKTHEEKELIELFIKEFGEDFYIEMHVTDIRMVWNPTIKQFVPQPEGNPQKVVNDRLLELIEEYNLHGKTYITQDSHMPKKEDKAIQDIMILNDARNNSGWHFYNTYAIMNVKEMYEQVRKYYPEYTNEQFVRWCFNSIEVLEKCKNVELDTDFKLKKPDYKNHPSNNPIVPSAEWIKEHNKGDIVDEILLEEEIQKEFCGRFDEAMTSPKVDHEKTNQSIQKHKEVDQVIEDLFSQDNYYIQKCAHFYRKGDIGTITMLRTALLSGKFDYKQPHLVETYFKEFNTLQFNGVIPLSDYFMTFENFSYVVRRAEELKGPGRGSAAGCFVSYTLDITDVRPDKYGLLMERFLQKERIGIMYWDHSALKEKIEDEGDYSAFYQIESEIAGKVEDSFRKNYQEEIFYLECNPGIAHYLLKLREVAKGETLKNERNSYVCYLLGICEKPYSRISKSSRSMPDIDYDSSCRDLICSYLLKKHGRNHFAYICNYGALKIKSAIKEILRVRPVAGKIMEPEEVNLVTKEVDKVKLSEEDMSEGQLACFHMILEENTDLREFFERAPDIKEDVEKILGTYKSMGIHAAGVILTEEPITRIVPCTYHPEKGAYITQLAKDEAEQLGLIKKDLLGLSTLEVERDCMRLIRARTGIDYFQRGKMEEVIENLPPEVARNYTQTKTLGNFQMNTPIAMNLLKKLKVMNNPVVQNATLTSLGRPGPMGSGMHLEYVSRENKETPVVYLHECMKPITEETLGVLVYQEQVMKACQDIGGFSKFESDSIRKAMGKKKFDILDKYKGQFIEHAVTVKKVPREIAEEIWNQMAKFAEYGFNKSHAISYSIVSCHSMYFYVKHPLEWITALFSNASKGGSEKDKKNYKLYYKEWKHLLKTPSISKSKEDYEIKDGHIYMPLHSLQKVGVEVARDIISQQPFANFKDFVFKIRSIGRLKKDMVEALIFAGCMDEFMPSKKKLKERISSSNEDFSQALEELKELVDYAKVIFNKNFQFSGIELMRDRLESGIRISQEELSAAKEEILNSGLFDVALDIISYRKYLLYKYHTELQHVNLKKPLKDALSELNLETPEVIYKILSQGPASVYMNHPELCQKLRNKKGEIKDSSLIAMGPTEGKKDSSEKEIRDIMDLNSKKMVLKQLEILKFTTYDFSSTFEEELKLIQSERGIAASSLESVIEQGNAIVKRAEAQFQLVAKMVRSKLTDGLEKDILVRERYLRDLLIKGEESFGWKFRGTAQSIISRETNILPLETKFTHLFYRELMNIIFKVQPLEDSFGLTLNGMMDTDDKKALTSLLKNSVNLQNYNSQGKIPLRMNEIIKLCIAKCVAEESDICKAMSSSKPILAIAQDFNELMKANRQVYRKLFAKIRLSEKMIKLFETGMSLFSEGLQGELKEATDSLKAEIENALLTPGQQALLKKDIYVFGTVFRPEKKFFIREVGRDHERRMMVSLNNDDYNINLTVYKADQEMVTRINDQGRPERRKIIDEMRDFSPVIVKSKLNIDLRNFSPTLVYSSGTNSVIFIEDKLN